MAPYAAQCRLLAKLIGEALGVGDRGSMYAATVHRFQGNERDAIICDLTDSTGARVGKFIRAESRAEDGARLLNVALSRAQVLHVARCKLSIPAKQTADAHVRPRNPGLL